MTSRTACLSGIFPNSKTIWTDFPSFSKVFPQAIHLGTVTSRSIKEVIRLTKIAISNFSIWQLSLQKLLESGISGSVAVVVYHSGQNTFSADQNHHFRGSGDSGV